MPSCVPTSAVFHHGRKFACSFEVTVTSVSLPPFVSRRGLCNTNQRLSLSSVPLGLPLNQRLSRVPNTCILCSFPAIKSLHAVSSQSLAAGLQSKAGSAPPTLGRYDGKVDTPCGVQCNLYTARKNRHWYQGTPDLASCRPSTAVLAFLWPKRRL